MPVTFDVENLMHFVDWERKEPYKVERGEGECAVSPPPGGGRRHGRRGRKTGARRCAVEALPRINGEPIDLARSTSSSSP